jgi:arylsulfatase
LETKAIKLVASLLLAVVGALSCEAAEPDRTVIPLPEPKFEGKIGKTHMDFAYDGGNLGSGGLGTLFINGKKVGEARIEKTVPGRFGIDTFGVGMDTGSPVSNTYKPPFAFTGTIHEVRVELK